MWQKPDDATYNNFRSKILKQMQYKEQVNEKVLGIMTEAFEKALTESRAVLAPAERRILFKSVMTQLLNELLSEQK
jgi:hypothetical protein